VTREALLELRSASFLTRQDRIELDEFRNAAKRTGKPIKARVKTAGLREDDHFHKCPRCGARFDERVFEDMVTHAAGTCDPLH
jgi:hypothetical protein